MRTILGTDRICEYKEEFKDKKIGLITNYSGVNSRWESNIDLIYGAGLKIEKLFTPEHGLYGAADGTSIKDSIYPKFQIPIISLYGDKRKPSPEDLQGLDLLLYDIQDVGLRYYTFIYTMANCMEAAAQQGISFWVLDRPNPLGGNVVSGPCISPKLSGFVGDYELPVRYGLTCGEIGYYFMSYKKLSLDYHVITMENYQRDLMYPDTGLLWNIPSPALPGFTNTLCYCGGCFFEATNISEGRGTPKPFQMYGAPYVDMDKLYDEFKKNLDEKEISIRKRTFVPFTGKYKDEVCYGVEIEPRSNNLDFIPQALLLMKLIKDMAPDKFSYRKGQDVNHLNTLVGDNLGTDYLDGKKTMDEILNIWKEQARCFQNMSKQFYLYE